MGLDQQTGGADKTEQSSSCSLLVFFQTFLHSELSSNRRKQKDLTRKQVTLTKLKRAPSECFSKNSKSYLRNMNCISLCQRADHVLNVGRMDTPHIQTHYDDKQTHLWIIIKTHVGSFKRDIHTDILWGHYRDTHRVNRRRQPSQPPTYL